MDLVTVDIVGHHDNMPQGFKNFIHILIYCFCTARQSGMIVGYICFIPQYYRNHFLYSLSHALVYCKQTPEKP